MLSCICSCLGGTTGALLVGIAGLLYLWMQWQRNYFARKGIKSLPGNYPVVGHTWKAILQMEHFQDVFDRFYKSFPDEKYVGIYMFRRPLILLKDLEIIKKIAVKDFDHFQDHISAVDADVDPLFGSNLVALKGQKWRDMRATLSPAFTSSKMRGMFDFVAECGEQMADFFKKEMKKDENKDKEVLDIELKDVFTRYTNDVIATSAFGLKVNSLEYRDNVFYEMGKRATNITGFRLMRFFMLSIMPTIMKFFRVQVFDKDVGEFFRTLVSGTMKTREKHNIIRHDMIHILMEAKKGALTHDSKDETKDAGFATVEESHVGKVAVQKRKWTDDEITAQAIIFFIAGFDTASTLLCFLGYEMAKNPDIQKKLQKEIDDVAARNNEKVTYNDLHHMKYMDMVVSEALRMWPPGILTDRKCIKEYVLPPPNDRSTQEVTFKVNDGIFIPIYSIHHDPQHYKDPEKFDPERFSEENKSDINPLAYLPFGIGPRNCIGSRFALMEVKAVTFYLLKNFDLVVTSKTDIPIKIKKSSFNMIPESGFWVGLKPREA